MLPRDATSSSNELLTTTSELSEKHRHQRFSTGRTTEGNKVDMSGIDLGVVVKVKGGIGSYRGERQIDLERISMPPKPTDCA